MIQQKKIAVIDTETAGTFATPIIYDFAWQIITKKGEVLSQGNYLIDEIVTNARLMMGAFYAKKIFSHYIPMLNSNIITLKPWNDVRIEFLKECQKFNVSVISAYNFSFDIRAIRSTQEKLQFGKFLNFIPDCLDIWRFACLTAFDSNIYRNLAELKGWKSDAGNYRTTAEHAYKYLMCEHDFIEGHTALHDVDIERQVLVKLFQRKKRIPYNEIQANNWRIPNRVK